MVKRIWLGISSVAVASVGFTALTMFAWMVGETHFDRPDGSFDRLAARLEGMPGVRVDAKERWVEAPTFSDLSSWIQLTVDEAHLAGTLATACADDYADPVTWSLKVSTENGSVVSLFSGPPLDGREDAAGCPDLGFDAAGVVDEVRESLPAVELQPVLWQNGHLALVVIGDDRGTLSRWLPLVDRSDEIRRAAGLSADQPVEINASGLSMTIAPGERDRYLAMLTDLAANHGVFSYWADDGGTPIDGVEKVQVAAPSSEHAAIEDAIRASGLHVADLPVRFLPLEPE